MHNCQNREQVLAFGLSVEEKVTRDGGGGREGEREDKNKTRRGGRRGVMDLNSFCSTVALPFEPRRQH